MMGLNESKVSLPIKVEGSYQGSSGDKLHAFQSTGGVVVGGMQTKVNAKLKELYNLGVNPDITDIKVTTINSSIKVNAFASEAGPTPGTRQRRARADPAPRAALKSVRAIPNPRPEDRRPKKGEEGRSTSNIQNLKGSRHRHWMFDVGC